MSWRGGARRWISLLAATGLLVPTVPASAITMSSGDVTTAFEPSPDQTQLAVVLTGSIDVTIDRESTAYGYPGDPVCTDDGCQLSAFIGEAVTLTPTVGDGWQFAGWGGTACTGTGPCTFVVSRDLEVPSRNGQPSMAIYVDAIAEPVAVSPLVTLSQLGLPAELQGARLNVCDLSDDGRYLTYVALRPRVFVAEVWSDVIEVRWHDLDTEIDRLLDEVAVPSGTGSLSCDSSRMSADGSEVAVLQHSFGRQEFVLWDSTTLTTTSLPSMPQFSSDGRFLAWFAYPDIKILDRDTGDTATAHLTTWDGGHWKLLEDGSAVVYRLEYYDTVTGQFLRSEKPDDDYTYGVHEQSADGRFLVGVRYQGSRSQSDATNIRIFRIDTLTDSVVDVAKASFETCTSGRSNFGSVDPAGRFFFTRGPYIEPNGESIPDPLLEDSNFDFYGLYWADVIDGQPILSSGSSITLPQRQTGNDIGVLTACPSIATTPDGSMSVYATSRQMPTANPAGMSAADVDVTVDEVGDTLVVMERSTGPTLAVSKGGNGDGEVTAATVGLRCGETCAVATDADSMVTLTAVADRWSRFTGWSGACTGTSSCTVTMSQVRSVGATFALRDTMLPFTQPIRVVDTRPLERGVLEKINDEATRFNAGEVRRYVVAPAVGVPGGTTLAVNIVTRLPQGTGWLKAYPCTSASTPPPAVSFMNVTYAVTLANGGLVRTADDGGLCIKTSVATDVIIDTSGWFPNLSTFHPLTAPVRLLDTRRNTVAAERGVLETVDETTAFGPTTVRRYTVANKAGMPAAGTGAIEVNVVAAQPANNGELRIYPCTSAASTPSTATTVTYRSGTSIATNTIVALDPTGGFCVRSTGTTHVIIDTPGWFATGAGYSTYTTPSLPKRLVDTRTGQRGALETTDITTPLIGGTTYRYKLANTAGHPTAASFAAIGLTLTVLTPTVSGNVAVWPCASTSTPPPMTSLINFRSNVPISNGAVMTVSPTEGGICVKATSATHITLDTTNWFTT